MKTELITAASLVIPSQQILVNVVSRRVRQLATGHRPLVEHPPGMGIADIALTEIIQKKLTFALDPTPPKMEAGAPARLVAFPGGTPPTEKAA
ncbi:MAG: DNA-directed RNA polymerase subunit omega [Chthoniobacterales bacterium]